MKKVCYIITKLELGGAQKLALYVLENIDKKSFDTFLITGKGGILDDEAALKTKLFSLSDFVREISPLKDIKTLIEIYSILKKEKPDIVHTHSSKAGILGRIAAKLAGVKMIVHTIHGYGFNETQNRFVKYLFIFIERFCSLFSDKLICVAKEDIKKGLRYKIAKKNLFTVIRAGIDVKYYKNFKPSIDFRNLLADGKNDSIVATIGPFKPQKNLKDFIKAAAIVLDEIKNVRFIIVGDGEQRKEIEGLIKDLKIEKNISLLGWRKDIAGILYACDIFVMTSLWEGLPCAIVEAMCAQRPVVANAVDGVKEIVQDEKTGFLIEPYQYKKTAEKIIYLIKNENERIKMGAAGKESIGEEFDLNFVVKAHENLYNGQ
ncbi:MAG: glycosyltransferase family 4 protein [Elusimicrobiota bacterium]|jgi:glycosyltransferase involved in cell wall biosynthesis|nr:glycosyltransferase family 4 protein [Elusimicrobiota bacterium]